MKKKENYFDVKDKRKWSYTRVYDIVLEDKELDTYEKLTYVMLSKFADNGTGQCFPSRRTLYELVGCSDRKLDQSIKKLIEKGYIKKKNRKNGKKNNTNVYLVRDIEDIKKEIKSKKQGSECDSLGGEPHSLGGEYGSQRTNLLNYINLTKIEEEESHKLSKKSKNRYKHVFNRDLSLELEQEILSIYDNENIINYCLLLAEKKADKPNWILKTLKDWKQRRLKTIDDIENYQKERKNNSNSKNKTNTEYKEKRKTFMKHMYR